MKNLITGYLVLILFVLALLSVLSYDYGPGYVYLYWRDWQLQTTFWLLVFVGIFLAGLLQFIWRSLHKLLRREKRKHQQVFNFKELHPYEQLGTLWLLATEQSQLPFANRFFSASALLNHVIQARNLYIQADYTAALEQLQQSPPMAFELAQIQRIEIYLALNDTEQALTHLEFLEHHALSTWLLEFQDDYQAKVSRLWGELALAQPWAYLHSAWQGRLEPQDRLRWLETILLNFDRASVEDIKALEVRYLSLENELAERSYENQLLWLKLLARLPNLRPNQDALAERLLDIRFDTQVFYLWFQQQLAEQPDYDALEQKIVQLNHKYTEMPVLSFALWHIYEATGREEQANRVLNDYPDDVLMSYLRIRKQLNENQPLIQQLNMIVEKDVDFLKFK